MEAHFEMFNQGFHKVCGGRVLELFRSHELMALLVGNENYDWEELEKNATYKDGYSKNDPTIVFFWQVFHELPLEEKKKFLLFLTGSDRIPIQGMKAIKVRATYRFRVKSCKLKLKEIGDSLVKRFNLPFDANFCCR